MNKICKIIIFSICLLTAPCAAQAEQDISNTQKLVNNTGLLFESTSIEDNDSYNSCKRICVSDANCAQLCPPTANTFGTLYDSNKCTRICSSTVTQNCINNDVSFITSNAMGEKVFCSQAPNHYKSYEENVNKFGRYFISADINHGSKLRADNKTPLELTGNANYYFNPIDGVWTGYGKDNTSDYYFDNNSSNWLRYANDNKTTKNKRNRFPRTRLETTMPLAFTPCIATGPTSATDQTIVCKAWRVYGSVVPSTTALDSQINKVQADTAIEANTARVTDLKKNLSDLQQAKDYAVQQLADYNAYKADSIYIRKMLLSSFGDVIAGKYDSYYRKVRNLAIAAGHDDMIIRLGHEADGNWYGWQVVDNQEVINAYKNAFRHVVNLFREDVNVPDPTPGNPKKTKNINPKNFMFDFQGTYLFNKILKCTDNPGEDEAKCTGNRKFFDAVYPGDDYVDILGVDLYNTNLLIPPITKNGQSNGQIIGKDWSRLQTLVNDVQSFASDHRKFFSVPEWGYIDSFAGISDSMCTKNNPTQLQWLHCFYGDNPEFVMKLVYILQQIPSLPHGITLITATMQDSKKTPGALLYTNYFQGLKTVDINCYPNSRNVFYKYFANSNYGQPGEVNIIGLQKGQPLDPNLRNCKNVSN